MTRLSTKCCDLLCPEILLKLFNIKIYTVNQFVSTNVEDIFTKTKIPLKVVTNII